MFTCAHCKGRFVSEGSKVMIKASCYIDRGIKIEINQVAETICYECYKAGVWRPFFYFKNAEQGKEGETKCVKAKL